LDKKVPVAHEADVIVVGGGPGGLGAAVMAARCGARTLLVERYGFLGGMAVSGEVHPFMANHVNGLCMDKPVYLEWTRRIADYLPPVLHARIPPDGEVMTREERAISKDAAMLAAEDLCQEAGVELLYHHNLVDAVVAGDAVEALILSSKSGFTAARAKVYVDGTGDGDLAALAGCDFEQGGPSGHCQPMTLCFKLSRVDRSRLPEKAEMNRLYHEARARGDIECLRENVLMFSWIDDDVLHFNTTRVIQRNGTSGVELSKAEIEARRQVRQFLRFFRQHVPGFEQAELHSMAHHIGIRETRRIRGRAYLTREAFETQQKFPDAIARVNYPIDIHNPNGTGTEILSMKAGEWYEIPYGCIVAGNRTNLLVAGRPISVDHAIHSSMRVMPPACSVGQAAGLAAALSVQRACSPAGLDGCEVRRLLVGRGAFL
jgi:glycine/D-amino acid oxidase-like deaminating enzyme